MSRKHVHSNYRLDQRTAALSFAGMTVDLPTFVRTKISRHAYGSRVALDPALSPDDIVQAALTGILERLPQAPAEVFQTQESGLEWLSRAANTAGQAAVRANGTVRAPGDTTHSFTYPDAGAEPDEAWDEVAGLYRDPMEVWLAVTTEHDAYDKIVSWVGYRLGSMLCRRYGIWLPETSVKDLAKEFGRGTANISRDLSNTKRTVRAHAQEVLSYEHN